MNTCYYEVLAGNGEWFSPEFAYIRDDGQVAWENKTSGQHGLADSTHWRYSEAGKQFLRNRTKEKSKSLKPSQVEDDNIFTGEI